MIKEIVWFVLVILAIGLVTVTLQGLTSYWYYMKFEPWLDEKLRTKEKSNDDFKE